MRLNNKLMTEIKTEVKNEGFKTKKKQQDIHDSKSLWNFSIAPGWKSEEIDILKKALMKFGIGKWKQIQE